jgi:hypothetical protein
MTQVCPRCVEQPALPQITARMVGELVKYDPATGALVWRSRDARHFRCSSLRDCATKAACWNGKLAGRSVRQSGDFRATTIFGKRFQLTALIWAVVHGRWPSGVVDHADGDGANNRLANLREVSVAENNRNRRVPSNNSSGFIGVHWCKRHEKWIARITLAGKKVHIGSFDTAEAAHAARLKVQITSGYHANHGRGGRSLGLRFETPRHDRARARRGASVPVHSSCPLRPCSGQALHRGSAANGN